MIAALILVERPKILQNKQGGHRKPMTALFSEKREKASFSACPHVESLLGVDNVFGHAAAEQLVSHLTVVVGEVGCVAGAVCLRPIQRLSVGAIFSLESHFERASLQCDERVCRVGEFVTAINDFLRVLADLRETVGAVERPSVGGLVEQISKCGLFNGDDELVADSDGGGVCAQRLKLNVCHGGRHGLILWIVQIFTAGSEQRTAAKQDDEEERGNVFHIHFYFHKIAIIR